MTSFPGQILIENPTQQYAARFIDLYYEKYGMKTVAYYTDAVDMHRAAPRFPILRSDAIAADYLVDPNHVENLVPVLKSDHTIAAVIPYYELAVLRTAELARALGLDCVNPDVLERFRNKFEQKKFLQSIDGGPRINAVATVKTIADVEAAAATGRFNRYVLKPTFGFGNSHVAFFDAQSSRDALVGYFSGLEGASVLMEEYLDGREYSVKGQIDGVGNVIVMAIHHTPYKRANGRTNLVSEFRQIHHDDPLFAELAAYATEVLKCTGLTRSPFHMDVIIDESGPCMVEVGARFSGDGNAFDINDLHANKIDVFDIAAHYYLTNEDYGPIDLDWDAYDARPRRSVYGVSYRRERIYEIHGIDEIEAMPEFAGWRQKPAVGLRVVPTVDLATKPWQLSLVSDSEERLDAAAAKARATLSWNDAAEGTDRDALKALAYVPVAKRRWHLRPRPFFIRPTRVTAAVAHYVDERMQAHAANKSKRGEVLIQDPTQWYAARFIDLYYTEYGMKTVAFFTDEADMRRAVAQFPILTTAAISASYVTDPADIGELLPVIRERHNIVAVIPYYEPALGPATRLANSLDLDWSQPAVLVRYRDKYSQKEYLRGLENGPRVNATAQVTNADDVIAAVAGGSFSRFVLKPNAGYGNHEVGFFSASTERSELEEYFASLDGETVLMEEFLDGAEYCVVGQTNGTGEATVLAVYSTPHVEANGRPNLVSEFRQVHHFDPLFAELADYARSVIEATELVRSPFHVDIIRDAKGPCLIEAGARFAGDGNAFDLNELHGHRFDVFDIAAHYYLTAEDDEPIPVNWEAYDSRAYRVLYGISTKRERIYELNGVEEIEAMPEFVRWRLKPQVGARVEKTVDLATKPWQLTIAGESEEHLDAVEAHIRELLVWNTDTQGAKVAAMKARALVPFASRRWRARPRRFMLRPTRVDELPWTQAR